MSGEAGVYRSLVDGDPFSRFVACALAPTRPEPPGVPGKSGASKGSARAADARDRAGADTRDAVDETERPVRSSLRVVG